MRAPWLVLILAEIPDSLSLLREAVCHRNDADLSAAGQRSGETLPRRRRELAFPKGSAFVVSQTVSGGFAFRYFYESVTLAPPRSKEIDRNQLDGRFLILCDNRAFTSNHSEDGHVLYYKPKNIIELSLSVVRANYETRISSLLSAIIFYSSNIKTFH